MAYEDTLRHLSESEREVTGFVFALAGYLVHDVHEQVPFMLLDSLEAIDSDRIARSSITSKRTLVILSRRCSLKTLPPPPIRIL